MGIKNNMYIKGDGEDVKNYKTNIGYGNSEIEV